MGVVFDSVGLYPGIDGHIDTCISRSKDRGRLRLCVSRTRLRITVGDDGLCTDVDRVRRYMYKRSSGSGVSTYTRTLVGVRGLGCGWSYKRECRSGTLVCIRVTIEPGCRRVFVLGTTTMDENPYMSIERNVGVCMYDETKDIGTCTYGDRWWWYTDGYQTGSGGGTETGSDDMYTGVDRR